MDPKNPAVLPARTPKKFDFSAKIAEFHAAWKTQATAWKTHVPAWKTAAAVALFAPAVAHAQTPLRSIFTVALLPDASESELMDVNADGTVAVGRARDASGDWHPIRWTLGTGTQVLPLPPDAPAGVVARVVSANGAATAGSDGDVFDPSFVRRSYYWTGQGVQRVSVDGHSVTVVAINNQGDRLLGQGFIGDWLPYVWMPQTGGQAFVNLVGPYAFPASISPDGAVSVGTALALNMTPNPMPPLVKRAYRQDAGSIWLTELPPLAHVPELESFANDVSLFGFSTVGAAQDIAGLWHAVRWPLTGDPLRLRASSPLQSYAYATSRTGDVIVGAAEDAALTFRAFRWTPLGGMEQIDTTDAISSQATHVSDGGDVVAGTLVDSAGRERVFRWTRTTGLRVMCTLPPTGITLTSMSADGSTLVGFMRWAGTSRAFRWNGDVCVTGGSTSPDGWTFCDDIDFNNNDVFPEDADVIDFFNVLAGAECTACNDIDFNNNGVFPEDQDVLDFFNVLAGGTCP